MCVDLTSEYTMYWNCYCFYFNINSLLVIKKLSRVNFCLGCPSKQIFISSGTWELAAVCFGLLWCSGWVPVNCLFKYLSLYVVTTRWQWWIEF